jgi:hypothetical protein
VIDAIRAVAVEGVVIVLDAQVAISGGMGRSGCGFRRMTWLSRRATGTGRAPSWCRVKAIRTISSIKVLHRLESKGDIDRH